VRRVAITAICVIALAGSSFAAKIEKRAHELWQNTPLLLKECSVSSSAVFVASSGEISSGTQGPTHDFCLLTFSSVQQTDDELVLSGKLTRLRAEGDDLLLRTIDEREPFQVSIDCEKKSANEQMVYRLDKALFSHAALEPNKPVPVYFRMIVNQYLGIEQKGAVQSVPAATGPKQAGVVYAPRPKYDPEPQLSKEAMARHIQGMTKVQIIVGTDGRPRDAQIMNPLGFGLDEEAVKTISTWKFEPATKDKTPVAVAVVVEINFYAP